MTDLHIDQEALADLHPDAWHWALHLASGDREFAQDVLQSAYLKILDGKASWAGRSAFKTWVFGVIRLTFKSQKRKRSLMGGRFFHANTAHLESLGPTVELSDPLSVSMHEAISSLPNKQGQIIALVFGQDFTIEEAAGVMNIGIGTARTHYARAKSSLRARLAVRSEELCDV